MSWTATLNTVTADVNAKKITIDLTINGGLVPYPYRMVYGFEDISLGEGMIRDSIRSFIEKIKKMESLYQTLKPLEGSTISLDV